MGVLSKNDVTTIFRTLAGMLRISYRSNSDGKVVFGNDGVLNDMTVELNGYTGTFPVEYLVRISSTGTPDQIRYSTDDGLTWSTATAITANAIALSNGITIKFGATTGHTLGSSWKFSPSPAFGAEHLRALIANSDDVEVLVKLITPVYELCKRPQSAWSTYRSDISTMLASLALNIGEINAYLTTNSVLVHAELRDALTTLSAVNVIPPVTVLGSFEFTDVGTGTFTQNNSIDITKFGGAQLEVVALTALTGAGTSIASLTGTAFNGDAITKATLASLGALAQYAVKDISATYTERFKAVTALTVTGGATGEKFIVRTKEDYSPVL